MSSDIAEVVAVMIAERSAQRATEWQRRRDAKARERAERKTARDAGLRLRHAAKLVRISAG